MNKLRNWMKRHDIKGVGDILFILLMIAAVSMWVVGLSSHSLWMLPKLWAGSAVLLFLAIGAAKLQ